MADVIIDWKHETPEPKVGAPFLYSDQAILCLLSLREVFRLTYRQTEGSGRTLVKLMDISIRIPDCTSLQKRAAKLQVALDVTPTTGARDIVIDSTGLKVFGDGQWKARKHGVSKRRSWRKVHVAIDPKTGEIVAKELTDNDKHGNSKQPRHSRDEALRAIRKTSRRLWKVNVSYHTRSLVETTMHRLKSIFGGKFKNRKTPIQKIESQIRSRALNKFTQLDMPDFQWK